MAQTLLTPCPGCGKRFNMPLTGCITGVVEQLLADSEGKCPDCGTCVVVDQPEVERTAYDPFADAHSLAEIRAIPIVDLQLPVRCRLTLTNMGATTVGDLLDAGRQAVREHTEDSTSCAEQLQELFARNNVPW